MKQRLTICALGVAVALLVLSPSSARGAEGQEGPRPVVFDNLTYDSWTAYFQSDLFRREGRRCGTAPPPMDLGGGLFDGFATSSSADCSETATNPSTDYGATFLYQIPVVVHIIKHSDGTGDLTDTLVESQIDVLNEDFLALTSTPGEPGFDTQVRFVLATTDPDGNPTTGITRTTNDTWFADEGDYWTPLHWDVTRYLNIYTNSASGYLGYAYFPHHTTTEPWGRVVVLWSAFGRPGLGGPPYDRGRTATHEVGHYLGLYHTFQSGCGTQSSPGCYTSGDFICDTNGQSQPAFGCPASDATCGSADPTHNYMNYTDDTCMNNFTLEQARRLRCVLEHYRPTLRMTITEIFADGFESGTTSAWQ